MDKEFANEIRRVRKQHGLSQKDLATLLNWNQGQVSKLESGDRKEIKVEDLNLLGKALGINIDWLLHMYTAALPKQHLRGGDLHSLDEQMHVWLKNMPLEVPVYLQRSNVHNRQSVVHYEYTANRGIEDQNTEDNNGFATKEFQVKDYSKPSWQNPRVKGIIIESWYHYPRSVPTDLLIVNTTMTPSTPSDHVPGTFEKKHWPHYTRVLIKLKAKHNGFYIHPALYLGLGKSMYQLKGKEMKICDYYDYDLMGVIISRRVYMEVSKIGMTLESTYGISKKNRAEYFTDSESQSDY